MRILLDQGTPDPIRKFLHPHDVRSAADQGWSKLSNGNLLNAAEASFDLLTTTDKNLRYQQNLKGRRIAILVLPTTSWPRLQMHAHDIASKAGRMRASEFLEFVIER